MPKTTTMTTAVPITSAPSELDQLRAQKQQIEQQIKALRQQATGARRSPSVISAHPIQYTATLAGCILAVKRGAGKQYWLLCHLHEFMQTFSECICQQLNCPERSR